MVSYLWILKIPKVLLTHCGEQCFRNHIILVGCLRGCDNFGALYIWITHLVVRYPVEHGCYLNGCFHRLTHGMAAHQDVQGHRLELHLTIKELGHLPIRHYFLQDLELHEPCKPYTQPKITPPSHCHKVPKPLIGVKMYNWQAFAKFTYFRERKMIEGAFEGREDGWEDVSRWRYSVTCCERPCTTKSPMSSFVWIEEYFSSNIMAVSLKIRRPQFSVSSYSKSGIATKSMKVKLH